MPLLPLEICLLLAAAHGLCWLLARGLGSRLPVRAAALGIGLPLLFLAPFLLDGDVLLAPTGVLAHVVPGSDLPRVRATHLIQSDTLYQFLPWELEVRHALRDHRLPLWSDLLDGGSSPWINPQAGVLSPLAMLARGVPIQHFLLALLALKMLVACEGAWLLARHLGISRAAGWLVAVGFTLGGGIMSWALFPHSTTLAWVPWLVLGCIRVVRRPRPRTAATTAAITAALLLSGHPETAAAGGLLAAACGIALGRRRTGLPRGLAAAAGAALLGFALAAPQLLPFACALPAAQRTRDMLALRPPPHDARLFAPSTWFVREDAGFVLAPLNPRVFGIAYQEPFHGPVNWADALSGYAGLVALAGSCVALLGWSRRGGRRALPWLGFAAASLLAAGGFVPFVLLVERVQALRIPVYSRLLPVATLALAVAGGFGVDLLLRRRAWAAGPRVGVGLGVGTEAGTRPVPRPGAAPRTAPPPGRVRVLAALGVAAALSLAADRSPYLLLLWGLLAAAALLAPWRRQLGLALLGLALGLDLVPWAQQLLPRGQPALFYPPNPLTAVLARETGTASAGPSAGAAHRGAAPAGRAVGEGMLVYPQLLPVYGIAEVRANNVLAPASYLRVLRAAFHFDPSLTNYYSSFDFPDHPLLSFLGVRAVVGNLYLPRPRTLAPLDAPELLPFLVYRNPRALPRWFVPPAIEVIDRRALGGWIVRLDDARRVALFRDEVAGLRGNAGIAAEIAGWRAAATPPDLAATRREAVPQASRGVGWPRSAAPQSEIAGLPATPGSGGSQGVVEAQVLVSVPGRVALSVPGGGERLLATSLPGPAGWQASGGGRRLTELTIDGAFLGVLVPAGVTRIELRYLPPGLLIGTALGMLALLAVLALARARRGHGNRRC